MKEFTDPPPRTGKMLDEIRRMPLFQQLLPVSTGTGWPIPFRRAEQVYATLPFFGMDRRPEGGADVYPPFATLTVRWTDLTPVEYVNLRYRDPQPEAEWGKVITHFPHAALAALSVDQYREERRALLCLFDRVFEAVGGGSPLSSSEDERFQALLRRLIDPALEPCYRKIGPKFFDRFLGAQTD